MEAPAPGQQSAVAGFGWTVLQRHGRRPLAVLGRSLLRADNRCAGLPCWSEITIHETQAGRFAAALRHTPPPSAGPAWRDAWLCDTPDSVRTSFYLHDPLWALPAWPISLGPISEAPDAAIAQRFRLAWAGLLGAVFGLSRLSGGNP
jgi:hypothetical protein